MPAPPELQEQTVKHGQRFWPRELALWLMFPLIAFQVFALTIYLPLGLHGIADIDFRTFYTAGFMLRTHHGPEMHDTQRLQEFKKVRNCRRDARS